MLYLVACVDERRLNVSKQIAVVFRRKVGSEIALIFFFFRLESQIKVKPGPQCKAGTIACIVLRKSGKTCAIGAASRVFFVAVLAPARVLSWLTRSLLLYLDLV